METSNKEEACTKVFELLDDISQDFQSLKQHFTLNKSLDIDHKSRFNNRVQVVIGHLLDILKVTDPNSRILYLLAQCQAVDTQIKAPQFSSDQLLEKVRNALEDSEKRIAENQKKAFEDVMKSVNLSQSLDTEAIVHSTFSQVVQRTRHLSNQIHFITEAIKAISLQCHSLTLAQFSNAKSLSSAVDSMKINLDTVHHHLERVVNSESLLKSLHDIGERLGIDLDGDAKSVKSDKSDHNTSKCSKTDLSEKANSVFFHAEKNFQRAARKFKSEDAHIKESQNLKSKAEDLAHKVITDLLSCEIKVSQESPSENLEGLSSTILALKSPNEFLIAKRRYGYALMKDGKVTNAQSPESRK